MANQGMVTVDVTTAPTIAGGSSNVAIATAKKAEERALSVDGKKIAPESIYTTSIHLRTDLTVGGGVQLTDGCVNAQHLASNSVTADAMYALNLSSTDITFSGTLSGFGIANLGTITSGSISVGSGGVTITNDGGSSGIHIGANVIFAKNGEEYPIYIDGTAGTVSAKKFTLLADEANAVDLSLGSITIGADAVVGETTIGGIASDASDALSAAATAQETADGEIVGYYQTTAPASGMKFGDIWIDTDYAGFPTTSAIFRYQDTSGGSAGALAWRAAASNAIGKVYLNAYTANATALGAANLAYTKVTTFYSATEPPYPSAGDLWVETDNGNKLWRRNDGDTAWESAQDAGVAAGASAIQPGGGVSVDGSKYITTIDMSSGITIKTSTSTAKTQITSSGMAIYNASGTVVVQADHTNGLYVNNIHDGSAGITERLSLAYNGTEQGYLAGDNGTLTLRSTSTRHLWLEAGGTVYITASTADTFIASGGSSKTLYLGDSIYEWGKIDCHATELELTGFIDQNGATANTFASDIQCAGTVQVQSRATIHSIASGAPDSGLGSTGDLCMSQGGSLYFKQSGGWRRIDNWTS